MNVLGEYIVSSRIVFKAAIIVDSLMGRRQMLDPQFWYGLSDVGALSCDAVHLLVVEYRDYTMEMIVRGYRFVGMRLGPWSPLLATF